MITGGPWDDVTEADSAAVTVIETNNINRYRVRRQAAGRAGMGNRVMAPGIPSLHVRGSLGAPLHGPRRPTPRGADLAVRASDFLLIGLVVALMAALYAFLGALWVLVQLVRLGRGVSRILGGGKSA